MEAVVCRVAFASARPDWTLMAILAGCLQTIVVRLAKMLAELRQRAEVAAEAQEQRIGGER